MHFGFRSEVGYDAAKDFTFLRTNTPDFAKQLVFPVARGSEEDKEIRTLLQDQDIVDFTALNAAEHLPAVDYEMTFGLVGGEKDETLTPENYPHLVLFGKDGSGALNLIRFWLLWANQTSKTVLAVGTPADLYGSAPHMNSNLIHHLDPTEPLREQFNEFAKIHHYNGAPQYLFLVGGDYQAETLEDRLFLKEMQNGAYRAGENDHVLRKDRVFSLIHNPYHLQSADVAFNGSDGDADKVSLAIIGDVNEVAAKKIGPDVPTRNARGVAWFSRGGEEAKRVKTYVVPRALVEKGASWNKVAIY
jgi:hypothetical protein